MLTFRSSSKLATAYGLAVTGTLLLTTTLFLILAGSGWGWPRWRLIVIGCVFGGLELTFFAANLAKVAHGGWLPLLVAAVIVTVMITWQRGRELITERRIAAEGPLSDFVEQMRATPLPRAPGTAIYPHPGKQTTPLALRANTQFNHILHQRVLVVSLQSENVPHIPPADRLSTDDLGYVNDGITHVGIRVGFNDAQNIPELLRHAVERHPALAFDPDRAFYYLSRITIERGADPGMATWRKRLFIGLSHNAASPATDFRLPADRTVVMGSRINL